MRKKVFVKWYALLCKSGGFAGCRTAQIAYGQVGSCFTVGAEIEGANNKFIGFAFRRTGGGTATGDSALGPSLFCSQRRPRRSISSGVNKLIIEINSFFTISSSASFLFSRFFFFSKERICRYSVR